MCGITCLSVCFIISTRSNNSGANCTSISSSEPNSTELGYILLFQTADITGWVKNLRTYLNIRKMQSQLSESSSLICVEI